MPLDVFIQKRKRKLWRMFLCRIRRNNKLAKKYWSLKTNQNKEPFMLLRKAMHNFLKAKLHIETWK
jgi:hypothetical protein